MRSRAAGNGAIGGRFGRWIGVALLLHFAVVCAIKFYSGQSEEVWWMSHIGLLLAGVGLVARSALLVETALIAILIPHGLWLFDCLTWMVFGTFPIGVTHYLVEANVWTWIATAHHFYLVPLLVLIVLRHGVCQVVALTAAIAVYLFLTVISRAALSPANNVNWAYGVRTGLDHPLVDAINRVGGSAYLLGLNAFVVLTMFVPTALLIRHYARRLPSARSEPATGGAES